MDIENFIAEFKKTFVYDLLSMTLKDEQLFEHMVDGDAVLWFKEQTRQMWLMWEKAKVQAVPEWISVEDGLPSDGQNIIAFDAIKHCVFKDGEFLQGCFEPDTGHEYTEPVDVTHWIAIEAQEQKV